MKMGSDLLVVSKFKSENQTRIDGTPSHPVPYSVPYCSPHCFPFRTDLRSVFRPVLSQKRRTVYTKNGTIRTKTPCFGCRAVLSPVPFSVLY